MNSCQQANLAVARFRRKTIHFFFFFYILFEIDWTFQVDYLHVTWSVPIWCLHEPLHNTQIAEKHRAIDPRRRSVGCGSFDTSVQATGRYLEALKMKKRGRPNVSTVFQSVRFSLTFIWTLQYFLLKTGQLGTVLLAERLQPDNIDSNCLHYYIWILIGLGKGIFNPCES